MEYMSSEDKIIIHNSINYLKKEIEEAQKRIVMLQDKIKEINKETPFTEILSMLETITSDTFAMKELAMNYKHKELSEKFSQALKAVEVVVNIYKSLEDDYKNNR